METKEMWYRIIYGKPEDCCKHWVRKFPSPGITMQYCRILSRFEENRTLLSGCIGFCKKFEEKEERRDGRA